MRSRIALPFVLLLSATAVNLATAAGKPRKSAPESAPEFRGQRFERPGVLNHFYKGNTHTHSLRSDGDSSPEKVIAWYEAHGYQFVAMTDHNQVGGTSTSTATPVSAPISLKGGILVMEGEEISNVGGEAPVHVNSLCARRNVEGRKFNSVSEALKDAIFFIHEQEGAISQINHPNYKWALRERDLLEGGSGASLLEVANQHPDVANAGDSRHLSVEALWDRLLSKNLWLYGIASDDMHDLERDPGFTPRRPGKGWVQVAADELTQAGLCRALNEGKFYSSTGIQLRSIAVTSENLEIEIDASNENFTTEFVDAGPEGQGRILARVKGSKAQYALTGIERGYIRAKITGPLGESAWIQPLRLNSTQQ